MRLPFFTLLIGSCILLFSCKENGKEEIAKIVTEWQDKEIIFPKNLVFTRYGQDTIQYEMPESDYKILLYVDSVGCTGCKLQLHKWNEFIAEVDSLTSGSVPVLFFFHPKDKRELTYLLKRDGVTIPVCLDENDRLNSINQFPSRDDFQCFLLDKDNKVVYIGNPIHNIRIREMYLSRIAPEAHIPTTPSRNTITEIDQTEFNLGTLKRGNPTTVTALIRNIGEVPLVVYETRASCGCTSVSYKKEPTVPGSSMEIEITYNAEDPGYFNRTVSIYGNMDNSPLIIRLKGNTN
ncbi:DUF1573 domain-containing protein [Proteiniphilum saccharofermentans]|uniref:DUF1573 domain-containing protein n=1 Tax=Proteiniphilum saccharofermentans TaxID=1642647 RepID=UPI0028ACB9F4|nr:DUF1573 domain-containing protein [Proteiniphilum saccharofermentans]